MAIVPHRLGRAGRVGSGPAGTKGVGKATEVRFFRIGIGHEYEKGRVLLRGSDPGGGVEQVIEDPVAAPQGGLSVSGDIPGEPKAGGEILQGWIFSLEIRRPLAV